MNDKANGSSIGKMVLVGIVGLAIGLAVGKFIFRSLLLVAIDNTRVTVAGAPANKTALITLTSDDGHGNGTCVFTDGNGVPYKYPVLKSNNGNPGKGDKISWLVQDGRPRHSGSPPFDLNFPPPGTGRGTPFSQRNFNNNSNSSGESSKSGMDSGDYPYLSVIFHFDSVDISCLNPGDPGVHIDQ